MLVNPVPDDKILDRSELKRSAEDNFKFDENSGKIPKRVENTVGKGEIARYSVFKRLVSQGRQKVALCGNGLTAFSSFPTMFLKAPFFILVVKTGLFIML